MRPNEEGGGGGGEGKIERDEVMNTVGSRNRLVARKTRVGTEKASGCIGLRGAGNSGPEAGFDHVNFRNRGSEGE